MITELNRSNVKPATDHRAGVGVEGLKMYGDVIVTGTNEGMPAKLPVFAPPVITSSNIVTCVAVAIGAL